MSESVSRIETKVANQKEEEEFSLFAPKERRTNEERRV